MVAAFRLSLSLAFILECHLGLFFFFFFKAYTSRMGYLLKVNNLAQALKLGC